MYTGYLRKPYYYETDQMGIIHHSNYIRWFEEARTDLLEHLGIPYQSIEEAGIIIPVIGVSCVYKSMVHYGDTVRIHVYVENYTGTRFQFRYEVINEETKQLTTIGTSEHCFLSKETNRLLSIKKKAPEFHALFDSFAN